MTEVPLPKDGPALVAGVRLPAGQRIYGPQRQCSKRVGTSAGRRNSIKT
jgi:hypothetical protein